MLYWLSEHYSSTFHFLHVFQYLTLRSIVSALTALFISLLLSPYMITIFRSRQIGQPIKTDLKRHYSKEGTPTMGGVLIIASIAISILLWGDLSNVYIWILLYTMIGYGVIGWWDDYKKVIKNNSVGLPGRYKMLFQSIIALTILVYLYSHFTSPIQTTLVIPFFKDCSIQLGIGFIVFGYFVIVGSSNAVNLTDGLDGLALMPTVLIAMALAVFAYLTGNLIFSKYLLINYIPGVGEITVFCAAMVGSGLGFLWYNTYPAQVFMGDVGALSLGAVLGVIAIMLRQELVFMIMGGVFVLEAVSVILQVMSFKLTGKRIFKMAPLHHHFELKGWQEPKVIVRFWIITVILVLLGLATLKLR